MSVEPQRAPILQTQAHDCRISAAAPLRLPAVRVTAGVWARSILARHQSPDAAQIPDVGMVLRLEKRPQVITRIDMKIHARFNQWLLRHERAVMPRLVHIVASAPPVMSAEATRSETPDPTPATRRIEMTLVRRLIARSERQPALPTDALDSAPEFRALRRQAPTPEIEYSPRLPAMTFAAPTHPRLKEQPALPESLTLPAAPASSIEPPGINVSQLTDQVIHAIDSRIIAYRERMGG